MTEPLPLIVGRRLPLSGAVNFRDIGGQVTSDNRTVKRGLVYRSDHLSRLSDKDQQLLQRLRFKMVVDFRTVREQQQSPDLLPADGSIGLLSLPVQVNDFDPAIVMERLKAGDDVWLSMDFFIELYLKYLDDFGPIWGKVLNLAASHHNLPLVFHCTGGKDRTGICAALLLMALGVPEASIIEEHDLSNVYNEERLQPIYAQFAALGVGRTKAAPYLQAPIEPLIAMFDHLKKNYGTIEDYLLATAGLNRTTLTALQAGLLQ
ncbi:tyrosine-protein phosphatase [Desulforhopalus sp. IMCC35007]|uniref:tyrosine-protein phosphatase n=1 Tax=Desulforhopalus sp. IMCC35007 TaxID=2569543 RepID=UPI0010ADD300|nr:tyrosine-protein phosphatase [Desulforhopalus sp. IMCC35007]TKB06112.1 tyrosine-protein phosphatase [Desulforhopalus sp. IMCC35007]